MPLISDRLSSSKRRDASFVWEGYRICLHVRVRERERGDAGGRVCRTLDEKHNLQCPRLQQAIIQGSQSILEQQYCYSARMERKRCPGLYSRVCVCTSEKVLCMAEQLHKCHCVRLYKLLCTESQKPLKSNFYHEKSSIFCCL